MAKITPAMAKNTIKRSLRAIVDRELTYPEKAAIWTYFSSRCAYCGGELARMAREGHMDHLVPVQCGGTNHISNRVLSCPRCNGDEKREADWRSFIERKVSDPAQRLERTERIEAWVKEHSHLQEPVDEAALMIQVAEVCKAFDAAVAALKGKV
ncbi:hypothetical protein GEOBRER4_n2782 [Citrifermentans bremense]|uniref:HNH nuclease domain-containing protein n=1 Tax=Citrifermentans bremense TaxID=60035 RepID=A0A6S6M3F7_9BACT|nr:HNH endonuclease signature motif containing protein [Citrifermentans bremense]BCG47929.1 hypothetical protein GEOBRER4_n2782 [Citrifermentans bremense]